MDTGSANCGTRYGSRHLHSGRTSVSWTKADTVVHEKQTDSDMHATYYLALPNTQSLHMYHVVWQSVICMCSDILSRICRRYRSKIKTRPVGLWKDIPMKERGVLQEGIHAPLDLGPITDPEEWIQHKEAVLKENFCEHVQKLHQDKNAPFGKEYQVQHYVVHIKTDRNTYIRTYLYCYL